MSKIKAADYLALPVAERIRLVEDIWDSIAAFPEAVPLTEEQRQELNRRLEAYHRNPEEGVSWEEIKLRLRG